MKRCIGLFMLCWLPIILLSSCINEDYSGCPSKNNRKMVRIHVDWHLFDKEVPTGMTVMIFPRSGGGCSANCLDQCYYSCRFFLRTWKISCTGIQPEYD